MLYFYTLVTFKNCIMRKRFFFIITIDIRISMFLVKWSSIINLSIKPTTLKYECSKASILALIVNAHTKHRIGNLIVENCSYLFKLNQGLKSLVLVVAHLCLQVVEFLVQVLFVISDIRYKIVLINFLSYCSLSL